MAKIGICGHFTDEACGQAIKTKTLYNELKIFMGDVEVTAINSNGWLKKPISLLVDCIRLIKNCDNVIILPGANGIRVFVPLFLFLNRFYKKGIHYVVVGGWLPELLGIDPRLKKRVSRLKGVYVETQVMINALKKLGLENVECFPNFKRIDLIKENEMVFPQGEPYRLCTFCRVMEEKGIEDAIKAVTAVNQKTGRTVYRLDIYGMIEEKYRERFEQIKKEFPSFITYKGIVEFNKSVDVVKEYFALLFPTRYRTEGMPGTIIDAYCAGTPVIASRWNGFNDIVDEGKTGYGFELENVDELEEILANIVKDPQKVIEMKANCVLKAKDYLPEKVINKFIGYLN